MLFLGFGLASAILFIEDARDAALALLRWVESLGIPGLLVFFGIYVLVVLLLLPGVVLTLGAGFVYGFWTGGLLVLASLSVGSALAFLIARHGFSDSLAERIESRPALQVLNRGLEQEGWKLVLLSRCLPGFPYKLSNYFFGLTAISFRQFFFANLAGVVPLTLTNVYLGSATADLAQLQDQELGRWAWLVYAGGFLVALAILWIIARIARRVLREARIAEVGNRS